MEGNPGAVSSANVENAWVLRYGHRYRYSRSIVPERHSAPPFVFGHGFGVSVASLLPTATLQASDVPTFVPDLPGFGRDPTHRSTHRYRSCAIYSADSSFDSNADEPCGTVADKPGRICAWKLGSGALADPPGRFVGQPLIRWFRVRVPGGSLRNCTSFQSQAPAAKTDVQRSSPRPHDNSDLVAFAVRWIAYSAANF